MHDSRDFYQKGRGEGRRDMFSVNLLCEFKQFKFSMGGMGVWTPIPPLDIEWLTDLWLYICRFPHEKLHSLDSEQDGLLVMRNITNQKIKQVHYRDNRPHLIAEEIQFELENEEV